MKYNIEIIQPSTKSTDKSFIYKIEVKGSLDSNHTQYFLEMITTLIKGGVKRIVIDIDDLQYLDSTGIAVLINVTKNIRKLNGDIVITRFTSQILSIIKPINMEKFIKFFPSIDEGVNYLEN